MYVILQHRKINKNISFFCYIQPSPNTSKLSFPGGASQSSDGAKSMADRELPQQPPAQDAQENDHDYDILDDQKLAYHAALTPPSVSRMVDYDTIENLQMGQAQSQYCSPTRGM